jgi:hypothetical protein
MILGLWFLAGVVGGILSGLSQQWTVGHLHVDSTKKVASYLIIGFIFRLALAGLILYAAIQYSIFAVLLAFAGLWIARWGLSIYWNKRQPFSEVK